MPNYLSATQVLMYLRCPLQYFYRYIRGIKIQPSGTMMLGSSVHSTLKENYTQKIESRKDIAIPKLQEFFAADFDKRTHETEWAPGEKPGEFKDGGVEIVRAYHTIVSPVTQPVHVEQRWNVEIRDIPKPLLVILDLVDSENKIRDHKVSSRTPNQMIVVQSLQLSLYALAYRLATGKTESAVGLDYMVRNKKNEVTINRMQGARTVQDLDRAVKLVKNVHKAIEGQNFYPCNPESWQCSKKWCGYNPLCLKEW